MSTARKPDPGSLDEAPPASAPSRRRGMGGWLLVALIGAGLAAGAALIRGPRRRPHGLDEADAKYLQDAEHLGGFILGDRTLPRVARAIEAGDAAALKKILSQDFTGRQFRFERGAADPVEPFLHLASWRKDHNPRFDCDRDDMIRELLALRDDFKTLETVSLKVRLMKPDTPGRFDGPWSGTLRLRMTGVSSRGMRRLFTARFECGIDRIDDDQPERVGWLSRLDAFQADSAESPGPLMEDMTAETGLAVDRLTDNWVADNRPQIPILTGGVYLADYDSDGLVDCLVTDLGGATLYRGLAGGRFEDVTAEVLLPSGISDVTAAWADFDNDGYPDLVLGTGLYRNHDGRRFEELGPDQTGLELDQATGFAVADVDHDGLVDLYVVGLDRKTEGQKWIGKNDSNRNQLWHNAGDWSFTDVTGQTGTAGRGTSTFAAVFFDADGDGWPDLLTCCEFGTNDFWLNNRNGTFRPVELPDGYGGFSMGLTVGDINNDGRPDPYFANMYSKAGERIVENLRRGIYEDHVDSKLRDFVTGSDLYLNAGDGRFKRVGRPAGVSDVGWAYGPAYVDLDNDGLLDIYAPAGFQSITPERPDG